MNEILRKLTISTCGFNVAGIKATLEGGVQKVDLLKVVGVCQSAQTGASPLGEYIKFAGEFRGINMITGEIYASTKCILPNFIAENIAEALTKSDNVEFGVLIGAKVKESSVTGYEFTVKPLIEPQVNDQLGKLMLIAMQPVADINYIDAPVKIKDKQKHPA